jgi:hypothetical protein
MSEQVTYRHMPSIWVASALLTLATATAHAQGDVDADWQSRSTAPGVFYRNNFDFADTAALVNSNFFRTVQYPDRVALETANKLSGRGAFRARIPATSNESTVAYQHSFDMPVGSQTKNTVKRTFYYQFQVYLPRYVLDHRFATVGNRSDVGHKFAIVQAPDRSFDAGEVVITNSSFRWFVSAYYVNGTGNTTNFNKEWNTRPSDCGGSPEFGWQNAIDAGPQSSGGQTDATSCSLFKRRYGPMHYSFQGTVNYGGGTLSAQGNPDASAGVNGAVWAPDAWNVVEVYINDAAGSTDTVKIWHAKRGDPPKLAINSTNLNLGDGAMGNYTGVQLMPRLEELAADSSRQDTYVIYGEVIASDNFIDFPDTGGAAVRPNPPSNLAVIP